jgi:hypothetical protein
VGFPQLAVCFCWCLTWLTVQRISLRYIRCPNCKVSQSRRPSLHISGLKSSNSVKISCSQVSGIRLIDPPIHPYGGYRTPFHCDRRMTVTNRFHLVWTINKKFKKILNEFLLNLVLRVCKQKRYLMNKIAIEIGEIYILTYIKSK